MKKTTRIETPRPREERRQSLHRALDDMNRKGSQKVNTGPIDLPSCHYICAPQAGGLDENGTRSYTWNDNCYHNLEQDFVNVISWSFTTTSYDDATGLIGAGMSRDTVSAGELFGTPNGVLTYPGRKSGVFPITAGSLINISFQIYWKWTGARDFYINFYSDPGGTNLISREEVLVGVALAGMTIYEIQSVAIVPNGTVSARMEYEGGFVFGHMDNISVDAQVSFYDPCYIVDEGPSPGHTITDIATVSGSHTWILPTYGTYVYGVTVDGIPRTDYDFIPPDQIIFSGDIDPDSQVHVSYYFI